MKNGLFPKFACFPVAMACISAAGETTAGFSFGPGFSMVAPEAVTNGTGNAREE